GPQPQALERVGQPCASPFIAEPAAQQADRQGREVAARGAFADDRDRAAAPPRPEGLGRRERTSARRPGAQANAAAEPVADALERSPGLAEDTAQAVEAEEGLAREETRLDRRAHRLEAEQQALPFPVRALRLGWDPDQAGTA